MHEPTPTHGAPVTVVPQTPAKMYRKAAASYLIALGSAITALQLSLPYLQHQAWWPAWAGPVIAAAGAFWQGIKQQADARNIEPVNLSSPPAMLDASNTSHDYGTVDNLAALPTDAPVPVVHPFNRDLRQEIPATIWKPVDAPLSPDMTHGAVIAETLEQDKISEQ